MVGNTDVSALCFRDTIPSSVQAPMFDFHSHPPPPHRVDFYAPNLCFSSPFLYCYAKLVPQHTCLVLSLNCPVCLFCDLFFHSTALEVQSCSLCHWRSFYFGSVSHCVGLHTFPVLFRNVWELPVFAVTYCPRTPVSVSSELRPLELLSVHN